jgi:exodeoxyribonuclease V alpha subunit
MQIRNNYDEGKEVFNGDLGIIEEINQDNEMLIVNFDGRLVSYDFQNDLDDLVLSYAMTVHKSQGGEYKAVIIPFHTTHFIMLKRNWAYTAISRGKQLVICIGKRKAMEIAIKNNDSSNRYTSLAERLMPLRSAAVPVAS